MKDGSWLQWNKTKKRNSQSVIAVSPSHLASLQAIVLQLSISSLTPDNDATQPHRYYNALCIFLFFILLLQVILFPNLP